MALKLKANNANLELKTDIGQLIKGEDGGYYVPSVNEEGNLTWTTSKDNMPAVEGSNIKGPQGEPGKDGIDGVDGAPGKDGVDGKPFTYEDFTPEQLEALRGPEGKPGKDGVDGKDGKDGADGTMTFEDLTEAQKESLKGEPGQDGKDGVDGYTPVKGVDYFDGKDGEPGKDGQDGYTPVKGTDYFTESDINEIVTLTADKVEVPTKTSELTNDSGFATETFVTTKIAEAELGGGDIDLSGYALKTELPTKTSQLTNDSGYITSSLTKDLQSTKNIYLSTVGSSVNANTNSRLAFGTPELTYSWITSNTSGAFAFSRGSGNITIYPKTAQYNCIMSDCDSDLGRTDRPWNHLYIKGNISNGSKTMAVTELFNKASIAQMESYINEHKDELKGADGADYVLTDADKAEIANLVIDGLPVAEEEAF